MKKLSLMIATLALVLGLSQCKKQEKPVAIGEKQHIVLNAGNGNDGSKVSADFVTEALNLTWDGNETITVSGGAHTEEGKPLTFKDGKDSSSATFEGDIVVTDESEPFTFTVVGSPNFEGQSGTEDGCETWIHENISLTGTAEYDPEGKYSVEMGLTYAVLKLDVSALGTSGELTISDGTTTVASVTDVTTPLAVFVAVPADGSKKEYTISFGDKTATKEWTLAPNTFYTKDNGNGEGTGDAIVVAPDLDYLPGVFTVNNSGKKVHFSKGNLWADGSNALHFEDNQYAYNSRYESDHVSYFTWSSDVSVAVSKDNSGDYLFCNEEHKQSVNGSDAIYYALSITEWEYLIGSHSCKRITVCDKRGFAIAPDGVSADAIEDTYTTDADWKTAQDKGIVFLPQAGRRERTQSNIADKNNDGYYWSSVKDGNTDEGHEAMFMGGTVFLDRTDKLNVGLSIRLVTDAE